MYWRFTTALLGALAFAAAAHAGPTVTISLEAAEDGQTVAPGATIHWTITAGVSAGDNEGLATILVDLIQGAGNAAFLDLPPADGVPSGMANFSRPDGITNPGEADPTTGYTGMQRGEVGRMNLVQIGGGQNIFGVAMPAGSGVAENADLDGGVGQIQAETIAAGTFTAPSAAATYTFNLENPLAYVLSELNSPPIPSSVEEASIVFEPGSFTFTVASVQIGDLTGDGCVDQADLGVLLADWGCISGCVADLDGDDDTDQADLGLLLAHYGEGC